jgi:hypothetical protein
MLNPYTYSYSHTEITCLVIVAYQITITTIEAVITSR